MFKIIKTVMFATLFLAALPAAAQKVLEKPIEKWSQEEAMEVLNVSAWAQTYRSNAAAAAADAANAANHQAGNQIRGTYGSEKGSSGRFGGTAPVVIRLHSGLPIRLALMRLNQIAANYDKMNDEAKMKFNESAKKLLDCTICQTHYVVTLTKMPNSAGQNVEEALFEGLTLDQLKGNISLKNDNGETRDLVHFIAPAKRGDSAVLFFARKDEKGNVLLTKENKEMAIVFNQSFFTDTNRFSHLIPRKFDFKLSKITVGEQIIF